MGLRTTTRTSSLSTREISDGESSSNSITFDVVLQSQIFLHPDAAISGKMAPALTEPLSPANKLSSSAASASPRPTAVGSPLQNSNTNNNNNNSTHTNNNSDSIGSIDENSITERNSIHNVSSSEREIKIVEGKPASAPAQSKGAFQLAFEQSVGVRKPSPSVVNGGESSQMGPMCDSKSSQPPPLAANSSPLIKSKISHIDPETAAKIITSQFEDFPSDIEEAITAEICLRQKLKSSEEQKLVKIEQVDGRPSLEGQDLFEEPKKPMEESTIVKENFLSEVDEKPSAQQQQLEQPQEEQQQIQQSSVQEDIANEAKELGSPAKSLNKCETTAQSPKVNIISIQELPPIKTDSTVTASEDDNIEERLKQLDSTDDCPMPTSQEIGVVVPNTPPRTSSAQVQSQLTPTNAVPSSTSLSSLTPLSTTSTLCGSAGTAKDFKDNTSEMEHDIEDDLLQVLKGLANTAGPDICDLAGFFSEYYEDVNPPTVKENPMKEVQIEIEKNQQTMQRKIDFLSRRLRKLQARYMSKQASEEISGLFEWTARITKRKNSNTDHQQLIYAEEKYHPVTTTVMRNVLKKIEDAATNVQHVSPTKKNANNSGKSMDVSSTSTEIVVPTFDEKVTEEIAYVSGRLQSEMREVQSAIDSDATASSSGGESADEMVIYNNLSQETLPISKRAAWRYSRDRAAIASRWSWLMSQISDLEFKIRHHTELHQQLRQRKGKVVMLEASETGNITGSVGGVNGYRGALPGASTSKSASGFTTADETDVETTVDAGQAQEVLQGACRTRAFQSSFYRKRKLFQTANVHTISKKAARPSTIKCGCQWPLHPCALCTGRSDPTAPRDLPDTMMKSQRVALLDPGYHPVLSFPEDISNSIFFESISRDPQWQNRCVRSTTKSAMKGALAAQRAAQKEEQRGAHATSGRTTPNSSNTGATGTTGKRKYTKRNHSDLHGGGSQSTTPLVANKVGKGLKKHQRNRSPDYEPYPRKATSSSISSNNNNNRQKLSSHQSLLRNAEQSNHHPAHSSLIYQHSKNKKIRKLSSASAAATTANTLNQSGNPLSNNNILNSNYQQQLNNQQHHSYNNELNFLHVDSLDGDMSTNGLMGPAAVRSRTSSPTHASGHYKYERSLERKSRTSYDIDNIVIPYSVAAATRVELLPYKEIPTPKWRIIDYDAEDSSNQLKNTSVGEETKSERTEGNTQVNSDSEQKASPAEAGLAEQADNSIVGDMEDDEDEEDISNEAMILRHERALMEERRKFQTFLKFPYSTRSRANRRIDSRAESSGTNTPDPASPAPNTPCVGIDQESIPSPFAPSTPLTPLESISENTESTSNLSALDNTPSIMSLLNAISKKQERRRTVSTKKENNDQRRSSTPDPKDVIPPYEPIQFPIPNDLFDSMLKMMPDEYPPPDEDCQQAMKTSDATTTANGFGDTITSSTPGAAQKYVCDQKLNNNNAFLTLNNQQKSIGHITGEDKDHDYFPGNDDDIKQQLALMRAPSLPPGFQFQPSFTCRNNLLGCSDTESLDSEIEGDDDPNDPEWKQGEKHK